MRYRIKIITYSDGVLMFIPQVKKCLFWRGIDALGLDFPIELEYSDRDKALNVIDLHYQNTIVKKPKIVKIEIEHIDI